MSRKDRRSTLLNKVENSSASLPIAVMLEVQQCISSADASSNDYLSSAAQSILNALAAWLRVESLSLLLYDGPAQRLSLLAMTGVGKIDLGQERHAPGEHLTGLAFQNGTKWSNHLAAEPQADRDQISLWSRLLPSRRLSSAVFVRFNGSLECCGVFRAFNKLDSRGLPDPDGFTEGDVAFLESVAKMVGSIFGAAWEKNIFSNLTRDFYTIPTKEDVREMCGAVASAAAVVANGATAALYVIDSFEPDYLRLAGIWGFSRPYQVLSRFPVAASVAGRVAKESRSTVIADLSLAPGIANREVAILERLSSCVAVPVRGTTVQGCLAVFTKDRRSFQRTTITILESLGLYAGSLLQARKANIQAENLRQVLQLVGHSLRSPLAAINQAADDLSYELGKQQNCRELIESVVKIQGYKDLAARRFETLLFAKRDILDVMGLERRSVDLSALIQLCVARHQLDAQGRGIDIVIKSSARKFPTIRCDPEKVDLVFDNLLENAVKYSWRNQLVEISGWYSDKEVRVMIADRGLGISTKNYERIFEAFGRSDILDSTRYIKGTGLGLQLVKTVVEAHGGRVEVVSTPFLSDPQRLEKMDGFETVFTVNLPR